jgi:hypothetical protein
MNIKISIGEALDRLSILEIKMIKVKDEVKLSNIQKEHDYLKELIDKELCFERVESYYRELFRINHSLWVIEDELRVLESNQDFGNEFIKLARSVYFTNDERADVKKKINIEENSEFIEEKSYINYKNS